MRSLFLAVTAISLISGAVAAEPGCGALCEAQKQAIGAGKVPVPTPTVCFYLEQIGAQDVPMFIYRGDGSLLNASAANPEIPIANHRKQKASSDSYCPGAHFIEAAIAAGGWVDFCNDGWTSYRIEGEALRAHFEAGDAPQTLATTTCLMDGGDCDQRLLDRGVPE